VPGGVASLARPHRRVNYPAEMSGHNGIIWYSARTRDPQSETASSAGAHQALTCSHCGYEVTASVLCETRESEVPHVRWLRCINKECSKGLVEVDGVLFPGVRSASTLAWAQTGVGSRPRTSQAAAPRRPNSRRATEEASE